MDGMDGMVKGAWYSRKLSALPPEFSSPCPLRPQSPAPWPCHPHSNHDLTNVLRFSGERLHARHPCEYRIPAALISEVFVHYGGLNTGFPNQTITNYEHFFAVLGPVALMFLLLSGEDFKPIYIWRSWPLSMFRFIKKDIEESQSTSMWDA